MRAIFTILAFAICFAVQAEDIVWHNGSVVLKTNEVVVGEVARQGLQLLLLRNSNGDVSVYPAHKVSSFRFYDKAENINRIFIAAGNRYFERVVLGKISVFRIQKFFDQRIREDEPNAYEYFIEEGKRVCSLKSFRRKYFDRIKEELELQLISHRHLDPNTSHGAVSLIILYNQQAPSLEARRI